MKYRVAIVDDNKKDVSTLEVRIEQYDSFRVIGKAYNKNSGFHLVKEEKPDLLFLDVSLSDGEGLSLLKKLKPEVDWPMKVVFYTANPSYLIQAVRESAFDFLQKPFKEDELELILYERIIKHEAEFLPYMGKNDFSAWWDNVREYPVKRFSVDGNYKVSSIFAKTDAVSGYIVKSMSLFSREAKIPVFVYLERLPIAFDERLFQYQYADFVYSNATFSREMDMSAAGAFYSISDSEIIQLF